MKVLVFILPLFLMLLPAAAQDRTPDEKPQPSADADAQDSAEPPGEAADERYARLIDRSPFLTAAWLRQREQARNRGGPALTFHGYIRTNDGSWLFSLHDKSEDRSHWVAMNESVGDTTITDFDPQAVVLTVTTRNNSQQLKLQKTEN